MTTNLQQIRNALGGGLRSNFFKVVVTPPPGVDGAANQEQFEFLCKGAQTPGHTIGEIPVPFRGKELYLPGDRTLDPWEATFYNDRDGRAHKFFEDWAQLVASSFEDEFGDYEEVVSTIVIYQLDRKNQTVAEWKLTDAWCQNVPPIDLAHDAVDALQEFPVTIRYNGFERVR